MELTKNKKIALAVGASIVFYAYIAYSMAQDLSQNLSNESKATQPSQRLEQPATKKKEDDSVPPPPKKQETEPRKMGVLETIENHLSDSGADVTIWHGDNFAKEDTPPFNVIVNFPLSNTMSCSQAKRSSYYILEKLYEDEKVRTKLSRVKVSIPFALSVSLGASDGVPMANNNVFTGPTNFWDTMEKFPMVENETSVLENNTWGVYLYRCLEE